MESPDSEGDDVDKGCDVSTSGTGRLSKKVTFTELPPRDLLSPRMFVIVAVVVALLILMSVGCFLFLGHAGYHDVSHLAQVMKNSMNLSADPCQDFYNYACGGWHDQDLVKDSTVVVSSLDSLKTNYNKRVLVLLDTPAQQSDPVFKSQARKFFAACKNEVGRNTKGNTPFVELLKDLGKFPLLDPTWKDAEFDFQGLVTNLTLLGLHPLFTFTIDENGVGMLFSPETIVTQARLNSKGYVEWLKTVLRLLGNTSPIEELYSEIELVLQVARRLLRIQKTTINKSDYMSIDEMQHRYGWLNWHKFVKDISSVTISHQDQLVDTPSRIFIDDTLYLDNMYTDGLVRFANRTVANFMMKSLLPFTQALNSSYPATPYWPDRLLSNKDIPEDLTDRCFFEASNIFQEQLHRMYVDEFYLDAYGHYIKDLIHDLKVAFQNVFNSKKDKYINSKEQLVNLTLKIGYPAYIHNDEYLEQKLFAVPADEYFEFYIERSRFLYSHVIVTQREYSKTHFERVLWSKSFPDGINGLFYYGEHFALYFPAVAFQDPLFNSQWTSSMKYGSIGTLAAYTLSRQFVYEPLNTETLKEIRDCFIDNFQNEQKFEGHTVYETANRRVWEYLDMYHGIQLSFKAYQNFIYFEGEGEPRIPGLQLNHDQLFFLSFAQMMCEMIPKHEIDNFILTSRTFPNYLRVMAALKSSKEFSQAYGCHQGDNMFNEVSCWVL